MTSLSEQLGHLISKVVFTNTQFFENLPKKETVIRTKKKHNIQHTKMPPLDYNFVFKYDKTNYLRESPVWVQINYFSCARYL